MAVQSFLKSSAGSPRSRERRESARVNVKGVNCDRGSVVDISPRGMRITTMRRWREGCRKRLTISWGDDRLTLEARCIWCRQDGIFSHAVGLAFDDLTDEQCKRLMRIADACAAGC